MVDEARPDSSGPPDHVEVRRRSGWRRAAVWLLGGLLFLALLAGALLVGLNTQPGRRFVADQIEGLDFSNGMKIGVGRIEGSLYGKMVLHDLTVSDTKGVFLEAPVLRVDWRPFAYVQNHVDIRSAVAPRLVLRRVPAFKATPPSDAPLLPDLDIDIDRLKIDRLVVEPAVTGQRRVGSLDAAVHIADRRAQIALKAGVIGVGGAPGGDRVELTLDAVPEANRLALNLLLDAPKGGVLTRLAGLDQPLRGRLIGRGDWARWDGKLNADLGASAFARLDLAARDGTFTVRGPTRVARLVSGPVATLLGPVTTIDLASTWEDRKADLVGRIGSDGFNLNAKGRVDLGANRVSDLRLAFALLRPQRLAPNLGGQAIRATATLNGDLASPQVDYALTADRLAFGDTALEDFAARGVSVVRDDHLRVPVHAAARRITGLDSIAGGTLANVRLDGDLAVDWPRIVSDNLRLRSDRIDARLTLLSDISKGLYAGAINGRIDHYRIASVGIFDVATKADVKTLRGGYALTGRVRARSTRLVNDGLRSVLGGNLVLSSDVAYGTDGIVRFSHLRMNAPKLHIDEGHGSYAPSGAVRLVARGTSTAYGPVAVDVDGTIASPRATLTATRPGLGLGIRGLKARIEGDGGAYRVQANGNSDYGPFSADVRLLAGGGPLTLDIRKASIAGIDVDGRVRQTAAGPFAGRLNARGPGLSGLVTLDAAGRYQGATVHLRARDTVLPEPAGIAVGSAMVDARIVLADRTQVVADAQLADARIGGTRIAALRAQVDYRGGSGRARLLSEGSNGVPFRMAVNAEMTPQLWRAAIKGRFNGIDVATASPARIVPAASRYELLPTRLNVGDGSVRLAGSYGDGLRIQSRIDRLDLAVVDNFIAGLGASGTVTGAVDVAQGAAVSLPTVEARLAVRNFRRTTAASISQPVDLNLAATLNDRLGDLRAVMRTRGTVIGRIQAQVDPLGPAAGGWSARLAGAPLRGGIRYIGPADTLFSFAGLTDQRLSGALGVAADLSCTVSRPCLTGVVRGKGLTYVNQTYGTRLTDMALSGRFTGNRLDVQQLTAKAGDGTVSGSGYISLAAAEGYPARFELKFDKARLADSEGLAATASGEVRLVNTAGQPPTLTGTVTLPSTRYRIIRQGSAQVPELSGVRFKPPRGPARVTGDAAPANARGFGDVNLDLRIRAPERLYVSGMGLESEWRANLSVKGTSSAPRISGSVDLVRGTLGFAGRSFELQSGTIRFNGGSASNATIAIAATETIDDVDVTINVAGTTTDPQISFSSTPGLPQDEIVSRILFGNSVGSLSTVQAVQLAASLNSLRGSGGGLNPLGKLRAATGIDRLRLLGPDDRSGRGTALAAGKYLTNDIYVEVVTDARGFTATQLEIALSKSLSILSRAGGATGTDVSVRYRKSY